MSDYVLLRFTGDYTREILAPLRDTSLVSVVRYWASLENLNVDQAVNLFNTHIVDILAQEPGKGSIEIGYDIPSNTSFRIEVVRYETGLTKEALYLLSRFGVNVFYRQN